MFTSYKSLLTKTALAKMKDEEMQRFRKRNNPSEDDAPVLVEEVSSVGNSGFRVALSARKEQLNGNDDSQQKETFEDIVPIVDDADTHNFAVNNGGDSPESMKFELIDPENDDQAGQKDTEQNQNRKSREVKNFEQEEYSERLSNDERLNLSRSKTFFEDQQIKSSRRYLFSHVADGIQEADAEAFENLEQLYEDLPAEVKIEHFAQKDDGKSHGNQILSPTS